MSQDKCKVAVLVGSLRKDSINRRLAHAIAKLAPDRFSFQQLDLADLPLYNQDRDNNMPEPAQRLKREVSAPTLCSSSHRSTTARFLAH
jgi:chromate reductase, NAD(P)H dehydrogenase (quinone)